MYHTFTIHGCASTNVVPCLLMLSTVLPRGNLTIRHACRTRGQESNTRGAMCVTFFCDLAGMSTSCPRCIYVCVYINVPYVVIDNASTVYTMYTHARHKVIA